MFQSYFTISYSSRKIRTEISLMSGTRRKPHHFKNLLILDSHQKLKVFEVYGAVVPEHRELHNLQAILWSGNFKASGNFLHPKNERLQQTAAHQESADS